MTPEPDPRTAADDDVDNRGLSAQQPAEGSDDEPADGSPQSGDDGGSTDV